MSITRGVLAQSPETEALDRAVFNSVPQTKTKVITPTNHRKRNQHNGPIRTRRKCM